MITTLALWNGGAPLIDPMDIHDLAWVTIVPLTLFVAIAYKSVRVPEATPRALIRQSLLMWVQTLAGMALLGAGIHVFLTYIVPFLR